MREDGGVREEGGGGGEGKCKERGLGGGKRVKKGEGG